MAPQSPKDALILLLHRHYAAILEVEQALGLVAGKSDHRPRIEAFHDAVRAYASGEVPMHAAGTVLSVEALARMAQALKAIAATPLSPNTARRQSASQALAVPGSAEALHPSEARQILLQHYPPYAVLFVSLLTEAADRNFQTRTDSKNAQVEEIGNLEREAKRAGKEVDLASLIQSQVFDQELRMMLLNRLNTPKQKPKKQMPVGEALAFLSAAGKAIDATIAGLDAAHFDFASAKLSFLEQSKDLVKRLAVQGMNLAGRFVQEAMGAAMGRGGRGF